MKKIGIQGIEGSFSEEAAKSYCNKFDIKEFEFEFGHLLGMKENKYSSINGKINVFAS